MTELLTDLQERKEQFDVHLALAHALEQRMLAAEDASIGSLQLSARHLMTVKSGLIIHLYNVVEATMSGSVKLVGRAVGTVPPRQWAENALREWLREHAVSRVDGAEDKRLETVHKVSRFLLSDEPLGPQDLKKPSGTWTDKHVVMFAKRIGVELVLPQTLKRQMAKRTEFGDKTPLEFLADRRNALAHGRRTFEDGAHDLTLQQIAEIAGVSVRYLEVAVRSFQQYVDSNSFLVAS